MFKGIALYADPSLRQVQLITSDATVDILGQFSDIKYQVRVFRARPLGLADSLSSQYFRVAAQNINGLIAIWGFHSFAKIKLGMPT